jgi:hypothetical protein
MYQDLLPQATQKLYHPFFTHSPHLTLLLTELLPLSLVTIKDLIHMKSNTLTNFNQGQSLTEIIYAPMTHDCILHQIARIYIDRTKRELFLNPSQNERLQRGRSKRNDGNHVRENKVMKGRKGDGRAIQIFILVSSLLS